MKTHGRTSKSDQKTLGLNGKQLSDFFELEILEDELYSIKIFSPDLDLAKLLDKLQTIPNKGRNAFFPSETWQFVLFNGERALLDKLSSPRSWVRQGGSYNTSPLFYAAWTGNLDCVTWVCEQLEGETISLLKQMDPYGRTMLHYVAWSGNWKCLAWVCEQLGHETSERLKQADMDGRTTLYYAAATKNKLLWEQLIQNYPIVLTCCFKPDDTGVIPYNIFPALLNLICKRVEECFYKLADSVNREASTWLNDFASVWLPMLLPLSSKNSISPAEEFLKSILLSLNGSIAETTPIKRFSDKCLTQVAELPVSELRRWIESLLLAQGATDILKHNSIDDTTDKLKNFRQTVDLVLKQSFDEYEGFIKQAKTQYQYNNQIVRLLDTSIFQEGSECTKSLTLEHGYIQLAIDEEADVTAREQKAHQAPLVKNYDPGIRDKSFAAISQTEKKLGPNEVLWLSSKSPSPNHSYLTGIAGIGKSTWGKYVSYAWAQATDKTQAFNTWRDQFDLVVLFPLRDLLSESFRGDKKLTLAAFIYYALFPESDQVPAYSPSLEALLALQIKNHRILFLLDGFDEIATITLSQKSKVLLKEILQTPQVVVTSRPYYRQRLTDNYGFKPNHNQNFHILGFNEARIQDFIEMFFEDYQHSSDRIEAVKAFLDNNSHIKQGCSIPILAELVCSVVSQWFDTGELQRLNERKTMTEVYSSVIDGWLLRYLDKFPEVLGEDSMPARDELCEGWASEQCGDELALLAYFAQKLTGEGKLASTIPLTEMKRTVFGTQTKADGVAKILRKLNKLGMLKGILPKQHKVQQAQNLHYFPHKTFQEYFTAYYLVSCWCEEMLFKPPNIKAPTVESFIQTHLLENQYEVAWWFVAGLLSKKAVDKPEHVDKLAQFFELLLNKADKQFGTYHSSLLMRCCEEAGSECLGEAITQKLTNLLIESLIPLFKDYWETGKTQYEVFNTLKLCPKVHKRLYEVEKWQTAIKENIKTLQPDETCARQLKLLIECKLVEMSFWHEDFLARVTESPLIVCYAKSIIENNQPLRSACWQRISANLEIFIAAANRDDFDFDADCYYTEISSALSELNQNASLWTSGKAPQSQYWAAVFLARFLHNQYAQSVYDDLFGLALEKVISGYYKKFHSYKSTLSQQAPGLGYLALLSMQLLNGAHLRYNIKVNARLVRRLAGELYETYLDFPLVRAPILREFASVVLFPPHSHYHDPACNWKLNTAMIQIAVNEINGMNWRVGKKNSGYANLKITCGLWWMLSFNKTQTPRVMLDNFSIHSLSLSELWSLDFANETSWRELFSQALSALTTEEKLAQWRIYYRLISRPTKLPDDCFQWLLNCYNENKSLPYARYWLLTEISKTSNFKNIFFTETMPFSMRYQYLGSLSLSQFIGENILRHLEEQAMHFKNASNLSEKIFSAAISRHSPKTIKILIRPFMLSSDAAEYDTGWVLSDKLSYGTPHPIDILDCLGQIDTFDWQSKDEIRQMLYELKVIKSTYPRSRLTDVVLASSVDSDFIFKSIKPATSNHLLKELYQSWADVDDFSATHERLMQYARCEASRNINQSTHRNKFGLSDLVTYLAHDFQADSNWSKSLVESIAHNYRDGYLSSILQQLALLFSAANAADEFIVKGLRYHLYQLTMIYASWELSQVDLSAHLAELLAPDINLSQVQLALIIEGTPTRALIEYVLKMKASNTGFLKTISNRLLQAQQTLFIEGKHLRLSGDNKIISVPQRPAVTAQALIQQLNALLVSSSRLSSNEEPVPVEMTEQNNRDSNHKKAAYETTASSLDGTVELDTGDMHVPADLFLKIGSWRDALGHRIRTGAPESDLGKLCHTMLTELTSVSISRERSTNPALESHTVFLREAIKAALEALGCRESNQEKIRHHLLSALNRAPNDTTQPPDLSTTHKSKKSKERIMKNNLRTEWQKLLQAWLENAVAESEVPQLEPKRRIKFTLEETKQPKAFHDDELAVGDLKLYCAKPQKDGKLQTGERVTLSKLERDYANPSDEAITAEYSHAEDWTTVREHVSQWSKSQVADASLGIAASLLSMTVNYQRSWGTSKEERQSETINESSHEKEPIIIPAGGAKYTFRRSLKPRYQCFVSEIQVRGALSVSFKGKQQVLFNQGKFSLSEDTKSKAAPVVLTLSEIFSTPQYFPESEKVRITNIQPDAASQSVIFQYREKILKRVDWHINTKAKRAQPTSKSKSNTNSGGADWAAAQVQSSSNPNAGGSLRIEQEKSDMKIPASLAPTFEEPLAERIKHGKVDAILTQLFEHLRLTTDEKDKKRTWHQINKYANQSQQKDPDMAQFLKWTTRNKDILINTGTTVEFIQKNYGVYIEESGTQESKQEDSGPANAQQESTTQLLNELKKLKDIEFRFEKREDKQRIEIASKHNAESGASALIQQAEESLRQAVQACDPTLTVRASRKNNEGRSKYYVNGNAKGIDRFFEQLQAIKSEVSDGEKEEIQPEVSNFSCRIA